MVDAKADRDEPAGGDGGTAKRGAGALPGEHTIEVPRTARFVTLGGPVDGVREVWFALHGYRQLARRFIRRFSGIAGPERRIVAPESLNRFYVEATVGRHGASSLVGGTWMTREARESEIRDYVRYLDLLGDRVFQARERAGVRMVVLGFSQGLHTAARWSVLGRYRPDHLILWGDYLPPDLPMARAAEALAGTEVVIVRGDDDPSAREQLRVSEADRLRAAGIAHRTVTFHGGHEIDRDTLAALARGIEGGKGDEDGG